MRFSRLRIFVLAAAASGLVLPAIAARAQGAATSAPGTDRIEQAIRALTEITQLSKPEEKLPASLLSKCEGIAIFPGVIKAAYGIGGQYGRGLVVLKSGANGWTSPVFVSLIGGSVGWQIGVEKADIILVFRTRKGIDNIVAGKLTLGAGASISAGPLGRSAEAATDLSLEAEILSYSKSKGLFAGISLKGATIQVDRDANSAFYGRGDVTPQEIFSGEKIQVPEIVDKLKKALEKYALS
jgi:lipid-binding SYLF domain-containing protein